MNALIVTADDFGLSVEVNEAVEKAHRDGILSAASLMVAGPAAAHAVAVARRLRTLRVGLHLVLVDGDPVLPGEAIPDLIDGDGRLKGAMLRPALDHALRASVRRQYAREIAAQFAAFRATCLVLDHVDAHEHFHVHPGLAAQVLAIGRGYGMWSLRVPHEPLGPLTAVEPTGTPLSVRVMAPWTNMLARRRRREGLAGPDAVFGLRWTGHMTAERIAGLLLNLPPSAVEIYTHPATAPCFDGSAAGYAYREELAALTDPDVIAAQRQSGRALGGYVDAFG